MLVPKLPFDNALCQTALNPNISQAAADEMLVQQLHTEWMIRRIFDSPALKSQPGDIIIYTSSV